MATATLQKEIRELRQRQARLEYMMAAILKSQPADLPYGDGRLKVSTKRRIERARRQIAVGKGVTLNDATAVGKYFHAMRYVK